MPAFGAFRPDSCKPTRPTGTRSSSARGRLVPFARRVSHDGPDAALAAGGHADPQPAGQAPRGLGVFHSPPPRRGGREHGGIRPAAAGARGIRAAGRAAGQAPSMPPTWRSSASRPRSPAFREMERQHGSLIRAMRRQMKDRPKGRRESGARYSMFVTLARRALEPGRALAARLPPGTVRLKSPVERIRGASAAAGCSDGGTAQSAGENGTDLRRGDRGHACPTKRRRLLRSVDAELAAELGRDRALRHGDRLVGLRPAAGRPPAGRHGRGGAGGRAEPDPGLQLQQPEISAPRPGGKDIAAGLRRRGPAAGTGRNARRQLRPLVLEHPEPLLGHSRASRVYCDMAHWPRTMPQYHVGHQERVAADRGARRPLARHWHWPATPITASACPTAFTAASGGRADPGSCREVNHELHERHEKPGRRWPFSPSRSCDSCGSWFDLCPVRQPLPNCPFDYRRSGPRPFFWVPFDVLENRSFGRRQIHGFCRVFRAFSPPSL